jgi:hypothetical protein
VAHQPLPPADPRPLTLHPPPQLPPLDPADPRSHRSTDADGKHRNHRHRVHERTSPLVQRKDLLLPHFPRADI